MGVEVAAAVPPPLSLLLDLRASSIDLYRPVASIISNTLGGKNPCGAAHHVQIPEGTTHSAPRNDHTPLLSLLSSLISCWEVVEGVGGWKQIWLCLQREKKQLAFFTLPAMKPQTSCSMSKLYEFIMVTKRDAWYEFTVYLGKPTRRQLPFCTSMCFKK